MNNKKIGKTRVIWKGNLITLRARQGVKGESLYLDYPIVENGRKVRKYEFLKKLELLKSFTNEKRKENTRTAIEITKQKDTLLLSGEYELLQDNMSKVDFIKYCEQYISKYKKNDLRMIEACVSKFKSFMKVNNISSLQGKDIKENLVYNFKEYLLNESGLSGESPNSYFRRFKKVIKQAQRDRIIKGEPARDITIAVNKNMFPKDVLTLEEIRSLVKTDCRNEVIKRAFLFSSMTGVRYCDLIDITWNNLNDTRLRYKQKKTGIENTLNLNNTAIGLIGLPGDPDQIIFELPTHGYCMRILKEWKNNAGIKKHVTWHVSRHSFATNLLIEGNDIKTTAGLLGQAGLEHVNRYVRLVDQLKEKALNSIEL